MTMSQSMLALALDSWERNQTILVNLLHNVPREALGLRPLDDSPSVGGLFAHMAATRIHFVQRNAPEVACSMPDFDQVDLRDREELLALLEASSTAVRAALQSRIAAERPMEVDYGDPMLFVQHLVWHEGYHHGVIKFLLKFTGRPLKDEQFGPLSWDLWLEKKGAD